MKFCERGLNIEAATPGLSLTPTKVIFESFLVDVIPVIVLLFDIFFLFVIKVPFLFVKEDLTSMLTLFNNQSLIKLNNE